MHKYYKKYGTDSHRNTQITSGNSVNENTHHHHHKNHHHRAKHTKVLACEEISNNHHHRRSKKIQEKKHHPFNQYLDDGDGKTNRNKILKEKLLKGHGNIIFISPDDIKKFDRKHLEYKDRHHHDGDGKNSSEFSKTEKVKIHRPKQVVLLKDLKENQFLAEKPLKEKKISKVVYQNYRMEINTQEDKKIQKQELKVEKSDPILEKRQKRLAGMYKSPDRKKNIQERRLAEKKAEITSKKEKIVEKRSHHKHSDNTPKQRQKQENERHNKDKLNLSESKSTSNYLNLKNCIQGIPMIITKQIENLFKIFDGKTEDNQQKSKPKDHNRVHVRKMQTLEKKPKISFETKPVPTHHLPVIPLKTSPRLDKIRLRHHDHQMLPSPKRQNGLVTNMIVIPNIEKQIADKSVSTDSKMNCNFKTIDQINIELLPRDVEPSGIGNGKEKKKEKNYVCKNIPIVEIEPEILLNNEEKFLLKEKPPHILELKEQEQNIIELFRFNQFYKYLNSVETNKDLQKYSSGTNRVNDPFSDPNVPVSKCDENIELSLPKVSTTNLKVSKKSSVARRSQIPVYRGVNFESNKTSNEIKVVHSNIAQNHYNNNSEFNRNGQEKRSLDKATPFSDRPISTNQSVDLRLINRQNTFTPSNDKPINTNNNKINAKNSDDKPKKHFLRRKSIRLTLNNPKNKSVSFDHTNPKIIDNSKEKKTPEYTNWIPRTAQKPKSPSMFQKWETGINQSKRPSKKTENSCNGSIDLPGQLKQQSEDELKTEVKKEDNKLELQEESKRFSNSLRSFMINSVNSLDLTSSSPRSFPNSPPALKRLQRRKSSLENPNPSFSSPDSFRTSTSMFLTHNYRKPYQVDNFQKRKLYGDTIRKNLRKKRSSSADSLRKNSMVPQVFEVRYVTEMRVVSSENDKFSINNNRPNYSKIGSFMGHIQSDISTDKECDSKNRRKFFCEKLGSGEFERFFPTSDKEIVLTTKSKQFPNYYNFYYDKNVFDHSIHNSNRKNIKCYSPLTKRKARVINLKKKPRKIVITPETQTFNSPLASDNDSLINILKENYDFLNKSFSQKIYSPISRSPDPYSSQSVENINSPSLLNSDSDSDSDGLEHVLTDNKNFLFENNSQIIYQNRKFVKTHRKPDGSFVIEEQENVDNNSCSSREESGYATKQLTETPSSVNSAKKTDKPQLNIVKNSLDNSVIINNWITKEITDRNIVTDNLLNSSKPTNRNQKAISNITNSNLAVCQATNNNYAMKNSTNKNSVNLNVISNTFESSNLMNNKFDNNNLNSNTFVNSDLKDATFDYKNLKNSKFGNNNLKNNSFNSYNLTGNNQTVNKTVDKTSNFIENKQTEYETSFSKRDNVTDHELVTTVTPRQISTNTFDFVHKLLPSKKFLKLMDKNARLKETSVNNVSCNTSNYNFLVANDHLSGNKILKYEDNKTDSKSNYFKRYREKFAADYVTVTDHSTVTDQKFLINESSQVTSKDLLNRYLTENSLVSDHYSAVIDHHSTVADHYPTVTNHNSPEIGHYSNGTDHYSVKNDRYPTIINHTSMVTDPYSKATDDLSMVTDHKLISKYLKVPNKSLATDHTNSRKKYSESNHFSTQNDNSLIVTDQKLITKCTQVTDTNSVTDHYSTAFQHYRTVIDRNPTLTDNYRKVTDHSLALNAHSPIVTDQKLLSKSLQVPSKNFSITNHSSLKRNYLASNDYQPLTNNSSMVTDQKLITKSSHVCSKDLVTDYYKATENILLTDRSTTTEDSLLNDDFTTTGNTSETDQCFVTHHFLNTDKTKTSEVKTGNCLSNSTSITNIVTDASKNKNNNCNTLLKQMVSSSTVTGDFLDEIMIVNNTKSDNNLIESLETARNVTDQFTEDVTEPMATDNVEVRNEIFSKAITSKVNNTGKNTKNDCTIFDNSVTNRKIIPKSPNIGKILRKASPRADFKTKSHKASEILQDSSQSIFAEISSDPSVIPVFNQISSSRSNYNSTSFIKSEKKIYKEVTDVDKLLETFSQYPRKIASNQGKKKFQRGMKNFFRKIFHN